MVRHTLWLLMPMLWMPLSVAGELPIEVTDFLERSALCEHFQQEPWPEGDSAEDKERRDFIVAQIDTFCPGVDETISELRRKYRDSPQVMEALDKANRASR